MRRAGAVQEMRSDGKVSRPTPSATLYMQNGCKKRSLRSISPAGSIQDAKFKIQEFARADDSAGCEPPSSPRGQGLLEFTFTLCLLTYLCGSLGR